MTSNVSDVFVTRVLNMFRLQILFGPFQSLGPGPGLGRTNNRNSEEPEEDGQHGDAHRPAQQEWRVPAGVETQSGMPTGYDFEDHIGDDTGNRVPVQGL